MAVRVLNACTETLLLPSPSRGTNASKVATVANSVKEPGAAATAMLWSSAMPSLRSFQSFDCNLTNTGAITS